MLNKAAGGHGHIIPNSEDHHWPSNRVGAPDRSRSPRWFTFPAFTPKVLKEILDESAKRGVKIVEIVITRPIMAAIHWREEWNGIRPDDHLDELGGVKVSLSDSPLETVWGLDASGPRFRAEMVPEAPPPVEPDLV